MNLKQFFTISLLAIQTTYSFGMQNRIDDTKNNTILITIYGGLNKFEAERKLQIDQIAVSIMSFEGIEDLIIRNAKKAKINIKTRDGIIIGNAKATMNIEIRDGLPQESDKEKYGKRIHIQPGGNLSNLYSDRNKAHQMRTLFRKFVDQGGYYVGICAGTLFVAKELTYLSRKQEEVSFNYGYKDQEGSSLYPHKLTIPEWPGKDWALDAIPLVTYKGLKAKYFAGPVFNDIDDRWHELDKAFFDATGKYEPTVIRSNDKHIILTSIHYEFTDPEDYEESGNWLYKVIMGID